MRGMFVLFFDHLMQNVMVVDREGVLKACTVETC